MAAVAACLAVLPASAHAAEVPRDRTPLPASLTGGGSHTSHSSDGAAFMRLGLGLLVVLAVIFGIYWLLKRSGKGRALRGAAGAVTVVDTTQLAPNRAVHLLRVGDELVLVGSSEHGVAPIRVYGAEEARALAEWLDRAAILARGGGQSGGGLSLVVDALRRRTAR
jgi:flagellar protein FliO/FliZ